MQSNTNTNIRKATTDDAIKMAEIVAYSWQTAYKGIVPDKVIDKEHTEERIDKLSKYLHRSITQGLCDNFVVEEHGNAVGCFSFGMSRDNDTDGRTAELIAIYVLTESRSCGYGAQCMRVIEELAKQRNCNRIVLWVLEENKSAIKFYERHGYGFFGVNKTVDLGKTLIEIRLEKTI